MAHVRDVHHVPNVVAEKLERPAQGILEQIGAEIADVGVVVDGRSAAIEADAAGIQGRIRVDPVERSFDELGEELPLLLLRLRLRLFGRHLMVR